MSSMAVILIFAIGCALCYRRGFRKGQERVIWGFVDFAVDSQMVKPEDMPALLSRVEALKQNTSSDFGFY